MEMDDPESLRTLAEARERACKLIAELAKQMAEVQAKPPDLAPERLAEGKRAMENALASAKRMAEALDGALKIASVSSN